MPPMSTNAMSTTGPDDAPAIPFRSHRRTVTETDIVNFVNLIGLHESFFIDMEYIRDHLAEGHRSRFAPGPMVVSLGMGPSAAGIGPLQRAGVPVSGSPVAPGTIRSTGAQPS